MWGFLLYFFCSIAAFIDLDIYQLYLVGVVLEHDTRAVTELVPAVPAHLTRDTWQYHHNVLLELTPHLDVLLHESSLAGAGRFGDPATGRCKDKHPSYAASPELLPAGLPLLPLRRPARPVQPLQVHQSKNIWRKYLLTFHIICCWPSPNSFPLQNFYWFSQMQCKTFEMQLFYIHFIMTFINSSNE